MIQVFHMVPIVVKPVKKAVFPGPIKKMTYALLHKAYMSLAVPLHYISFESFARNTKICHDQNVKLPPQIRKKNSDLEAARKLWGSRVDWVLTLLTRGMRRSIDQIEYCGAFFWIRRAVKNDRTNVRIIRSNAQNSTKWLILALQPVLSRLWSAEMLLFVILNVLWIGFTDWYYMQAIIDESGIRFNFFSSYLKSL